MKELELLIENFWIIKDRDKELYFKIKDKIPQFKAFLDDKLGYKLIYNPHLIKLEKLPGLPESWMGIPDFEDKYEYAFLCVLLIFLEDRGKGEQFVLSQLTEFIADNFPTNTKIDWTIFKQRKYLVKVLKFALSIGLMNTDDGDEQDFVNQVETEVLYESTGLSRYFMRNFTGDILNFSSHDDFINSEWLDTEKDKGIVRRHRVYRRLLMSPAVYSESSDDSDFVYIKNYRGMIQKDIEDAIGANLHVHKTSAYVLLTSSMHNFKNSFPDGKNISEIVLLLNTVILGKIKEGSICQKDDDLITISRLAFQNLVSEMFEKYSKGFSKEYRESSIDKLTKEILELMKSYQMLRENPFESEIIIMPLIAKVCGRFPEDFDS